MFNNIDRVAITQLANRYDVPPAWAFALAEVESAGRAFWTVKGKPLPAINLEGHYFYRNLPVGKRDIAVRQGLANKKARKTVVPNSFAGRYAMLEKWMELDETAALMSISMGVGQVMGEHYSRLGFKSVQDMWQTAKSSLAGQVELMLRFVTTDKKIMRAIHAKNYKTVAHLYNGPAYKTNKYDTKIAAAVKKYETTVSPTGAMQIGKQSYDTKAEIAAITSLGFPTVRAFQQANGLDADGIIGPITRQAIEEVTAAAKAVPTVEATKIAASVGAFGTIAVIAEQIVGVTDQIKPVLQMLDGFGATGSQIALVMGGSVIIGMTVFGVIKAMQGIRGAAAA